MKSNIRIKGYRKLYRNDKSLVWNIMNGSSNPKCEMVECIVVLVFVALFVAFPFRKMIMREVFGESRVDQVLNSPEMQEKFLVYKLADMDYNQAMWVRIYDTLEEFGVDRTKLGRFETKQHIFIMYEGRHIVKIERISEAIVTDYSKIKNIPKPKKEPENKIVKKQEK